MLIIFTLLLSVIYVKGLQITEEKIVAQSENIWHNGTISKEHRILFSLPWKSRNDAFRVFLGSKTATKKNPLLTAIQTTGTILSWSLPMTIQENATVNKVARTLCPSQEEWNSNEIKLELISESPTPIDYSFSIVNVSSTEFNLKVGEEKQMQSSPTEPQFVRFSFPKNVDQIIIKATSDDTVCMIVSIQDTKCPIYDLASNVFNKGIHQSMTKLAAINVNKRLFGDSFYVVFVVWPFPHKNCWRASNQANWTSQGIKHFNITVLPPISDRDYQVAIALSIAGLAFTYFVTLGSSLVWKIFLKNQIQKRKLNQKASKQLNEYQINTSGGIELEDFARDNYGFEEESATKQQPNGEVATVQRKTPSDTVEELSRKPWKEVNLRYSMYHWNIWIVSLFYVPPVVQLVLGYQEVVLATGDEDLCYYNFLCAVPLGNVAAFNNIFSNIGYVMLGLLFLLQVFLRDREYKQKLQELSDNGENVEGLPNYFGIFYAIGSAMMIEGVMSASYHVCPNFSNFQFDTAFMYIISALGILKIYQKRHPDVDPGPNITFIVLSLVVLLSVIGVSFNGLAFWIVFAAAYTVLLINLTVELYYKGRRHVGLSCWREFQEELKQESTRDFMKISYPDRIVFLVLGNLLNISFIVLGLVFQTKRFGTYMLGIFIANLLLYTTFYLVMKLRCKERIRWRPIIYIILSTTCWIPGLYYFFSVKYNTNVPPAVSREENTECLLFSFYDVHDIWHFLSALGLFFAFKILLSMDDDLKRVPKSQIQAF